MLTKMLPEQIAKFWDIIKFAVEQSLPPVAGEHPDKMNRILASALSGKAEVWASYTRGSESTKLEGIAVTRILYDDVSGTRSLLIYCIYGYTAISKNSWLHALEVMAKYAKSRGCQKMTAYTELPYLVSIARHLGADTRYTFVSFNVDEITQNLDKLGQEI